MARGRVLIWAPFSLLSLRTMGLSLHEIAADATMPHPAEWKVQVLGRGLWGK